MLVFRRLLCRLVRPRTLISAASFLALTFLGVTCVWMVTNNPEFVTQGESLGDGHHQPAAPPRGASGELRHVLVPPLLSQSQSSLPGSQQQHTSSRNAAKLQAVVVPSLRDKIPFNTSGASGPLMTPEFIKHIELDLSERQRRVKEVCARYGLGLHASIAVPQSIKYPPTPHYDLFYIDRKHELAWCPIYKAASTNWMHNFSLLGGLKEGFLNSTKEQPNVVARRIWPSLEYEQVIQAFKFCLKFMIVRHPFERLVSAFRDKLENVNIGFEHGVEHFYTKYGRKIVAKYRKNGIRPLNAYTSDQDNPSLIPPKGIEPTFDEFVKYLVDTNLVYYADDHWMPYYLHCTPCSLQYDVIAKFETLDRDQKYIIQQKGLQNLIHSSWKHMTKGHRTSTSALKYFATISRSDVLRLYEKYKVDFELFDYSIDEYLTHALVDEV
ncbi:carbohydrate sulfotransferase 11-like [Oratosquilla oratoria]|uniref:carbohydrate sulfotransferase 11-like n=1 Tax=Oratosquilla oratoria TaxID=337810 RepID=UPI003F765C21